MIPRGETASSPATLGTSMLPAIMKGRGLFQNPVETSTSQSQERGDVNQGSVLS